MGCNLLKKSCYTNSDITTAPNPSPSNWELLNYWEFPNCFLLEVRYLDCTNFEGHKLLVFDDKEFCCNIIYGRALELDPHFSEDARISPVARFRPDDRGKTLAIQLCKVLGAHYDNAN